MARLLFYSLAAALVLHLLMASASPASAQEAPPERPAEAESDARRADDESADDEPADDEPTDDEPADDEPADAGEPASDDSTTPKERSGPAVREAPSPILLQTDKSGALVPTPLFAPDDRGELKEHIISWEVIDRLLAGEAEQQSPRAACQRLMIRGSSHGARARLEIEMTFLAPPRGWVRAPLGLSNLIVEKVETPTGGFLQFDEREGYVFWMPPTREPAPRPPQPPEDEDAGGGAEAAAEMMPQMPSLQPVERRLKIEASVAVAAAGRERRFSLRAPRAPDARLELLVDTPDVQASILGG
ncbi:MAG: hypothetical protein KY475_27625, partial [Planctomycetes bacterium]|nr:hypothetical protein [Planctomycetota bacterium]